MGALTTIILAIILLLILVIFFPKIIELLELAKIVLSNNGLNANFGTSQNLTQNSKGSSYIINYTLAVINRDRQENGLSNVTLSNMSSGQQHADNMLEYNYFSHWDIYGMKPYMRYTLLGGRGSVQENVAYTKSGVKACIGSLCTTYGDVNITSAINQLEYNMMYNDSICCNNGHRLNILNPNHNQVSIGVATNGSSLYLVEDFINNYITWLNGTPGVGSGNEVYLKGIIASGYALSSVEISYDPPISAMNQAQLDQTSEYSYGAAIAGVVQNPLQYYPSLVTIVADNYYQSGSNFLVSFSLEKAISEYGAGEYTIEVWLNGTGGNSSFIGSTYTLFVNSQGNTYLPSSA